MGYRIPYMCTNGTSTAGDSYYPFMNCLMGLHTTTEANVQTPISIAGVSSNMYVNVWANSSGSSTPIRSRKNGADGNMLITVGAGATGRFFDNSNTDTLSPGDVYNFFVDRSGTTQIGIIGAHFEADDGTIVNKVGVWGSANYASGTSYVTFVGGLDSITDGSAAQNPRLLVDCVAKNFFCKPAANSRTSATTIATRKNAGAGGMSLSFGAGNNDLKIDSVNTVTLSAGDVYNYQRVTSAGSGSFSIGMIGCDLHYPANVYQSLVNDAGGASYSATTPRYSVPFGFTTANGSENPATVPLYGSGTLSDFYFWVMSNAATADQTFDLRKNNSDTAISVVVPAAGTGERSDLVNSVTFANGDYLNYRYRKPTGTGATVVRWFTMKVTFDLPPTDGNFFMFMGG